VNIVLFLVAQSSKISPYLHNFSGIAPLAQDVTAAGIAPLEAARWALSA
jgi:hypothetical protein